MTINYYFYDCSFRFARKMILLGNSFGLMIEIVSSLRLFVPVPNYWRRWTIIRTYSQTLSICHIAHAAPSHVGLLLKKTLTFLMSFLTADILNTNSTLSTYRWDGCRIVLQIWFENVSISRLFFLFHYRNVHYLHIFYFV